MIDRPPPRSADERAEDEAYKAGWDAGLAGIAGDPPEGNPSETDAAELFRRMAWYQGWRGGMINRLRKGRE